MINSSSPNIIGLVKAWGRIKVHEKGYRVEKALITHILATDRSEAKGIAKLPGFVKRGCIVTSDRQEFLEIATKTARQKLINIPREEL